MIKKIVVMIILSLIAFVFFFARMRDNGEEVSDISDDTPVIAAGKQQAAAPAVKVTEEKWNCKSWCANHKAKNRQKCTWKKNCAGCNFCK